MAPSLLQVLSSLLAVCITTSAPCLVTSEGAVLLTSRQQFHVCATGMKREYLLVVEGEPGIGYSAFMPDFPGIYPIGSTVHEIKLLTKEAVKDELEFLKEEKKSAPKPKKRNSLALKSLWTALTHLRRCSWYQLFWTCPISNTGQVHGSTADDDKHAGTLPRLVRPLEAAAQICMQQIRL